MFVLSFLNPFVETIQKCYQLYVEKYGAIESLDRHLLNPDIKLQKTLPGEGFHVWLCEVGGILVARRFLLCMLYLNDIDEGGETEFINLVKPGTYIPYLIQPKRGRLLMFPPMWPWPHAGLKPV